MLFNRAQSATCGVEQSSPFSVQLEGQQTLCGECSTGNARRRRTQRMTINTGNTPMTTELSPNLGDGRVQAAAI